MKTLSKCIHAVVDVILFPLKFIFPFLIFIIFLTGVCRLIENTFQLYSFRKGMVEAITDVNDPEGGGFSNKTNFIVRDVKDKKEYIISVGTMHGVIIGDTLDFKSYPHTGQIGFKKNGIQFTNSESIYDFLLPILSVMIGWFYLKLYIFPLYKRFFKKDDTI